MLTSNWEADRDMVTKKIPCQVKDRHFVSHSVSFLCFVSFPIPGFITSQLIAANLPLEIGRQLTNVCTVRFATKELSSMFFELWFVVPGC